MIKRVLPFMLTLTIGLLLGFWFNPSQGNYRHNRFMKRCSGSYTYAPPPALAPPIDRALTPPIDGTWAVMKQQPVVDYTKEARRNHVTGMVRLRVLLAATGKVSQVMPLETLPDGLTDAAIDSAWKTTFIPATENGRPVSVWVELVHEFNGDGVLSYAKDDVYEVLRPETDVRNLDAR